MLCKIKKKENHRSESGCPSSVGEIGAPPTFTAGVGLDKFLLGAGLLELGSQPSQLRQDFVDQTDLGGKVVLVNVESQMAADEALREC
jgi:hypothetical protein